MAVRKLEEDVGVRLLHRTTRSVQLTEDGRVFHARARDLLAEVDDLHSMFAGDRVALRGRLRVDLPTEVARDRPRTLSADHRLQQADRGHGHEMHVRPPSTARCASSCAGA